MFVIPLITRAPVPLLYDKTVPSNLFPVGFDWAVTTTEFPVM
jgi:hypothetical protein